MQSACKSHEYIQCTAVGDRTICQCWPHPGQIRRNGDYDDDDDEDDDRHKGAGGWFVGAVVIAALVALGGFLLIQNTPTRPPDGMKPAVPNESCRRAVEAIAKNYTVGQALPKDFTDPGLECIRSVSNARNYQLQREAFEKRKLGFTLLWTALAILVVGLLVALVAQSTSSSERKVELPIVVSPAHRPTIVSSVVQPIY